MSPSEAVVGWVLVNAVFAAGGLAAVVLWVQYEAQAARYRERHARREEPSGPRPITPEDRARAAVADHLLLAEVAREFAEHSR